MIKGYDAWKLRSDLDDADRRQGRPRLCEFCDAPLSDDAWAEWSTDGDIILFCDECATEKELGEDEGTGRR